MKKQKDFGLFLFILWVSALVAFAEEGKIINYAALELVSIEKTDEIELRHKPLTIGGKTIEREPEADVFGLTKDLQSLQPEEGEYALIIVVRIENRDKWYIFEKMTSSYVVVDTEGQEYEEEGKAGEADPGKSDWRTEILVEELGWVPLIPPTLAMGSEIAPGKSICWVFIFHLPEGRKPKKFLFNYVVGESRNPVLGKRWDGQSSVLLRMQEK